MLYNYFMFPVNYIAITQGFTSGKHNGIDLGWSLLHGGRSVPVLCPYDGIVESVEKQYTGGNVLILRHNYNNEIIYTEFGHLKDNSIRYKKGDKIKQGDIIAYTGNSGMYFDSKKNKWMQVPYHLHYGVYKSNVFSYKTNKWIDPLTITYLFPNQKYDGDKKYNILKINKKYNIGIYECLYNLKLRCEPNINCNCKKYKELNEVQQDACVYKNPNDNAVYKKGTKFTAIDIIQNGNDIWAKTFNNAYINISIDGYANCKFVK